MKYHFVYSGPFKAKIWKCYDDRRRW